MNLEVHSGLVIDRFGTLGHRALRNDVSLLFINDRNEAVSNFFINNCYPGKYLCIVLKSAGIFSLEWRKAVASCSCLTVHISWVWQSLFILRGLLLSKEWNISMCLWNISREALCGRIGSYNCRMPSELHW